MPFACSSLPTSKGLNHYKYFFSTIPYFKRLLHNPMHLAMMLGVLGAISSRIQGWKVKRRKQKFAFWIRKCFCLLTEKQKQIATCCSKMGCVCDLCCHKSKVKRGGVCRGNRELGTCYSWKNDHSDKFQAQLVTTQRKYKAKSPQQIQKGIEAESILCDQLLKTRKRSSLNFWCFVMKTWSLYLYRSFLPTSSTNHLQKV